MSEHTPELIYENVPGTGMLLKGKLFGNQSNFVEYKVRENVPVPLFTSIWTQFPSKEYSAMMDATGKEIARRYNSNEYLESVRDSQAKELTSLQEKVKTLEAENGHLQDSIIGLTFKIEELQAENERLKVGMTTIANAKDTPKNISGKIYELITA